MTIAQIPASPHNFTQGRQGNQIDRGGLPRR